MFCQKSESIAAEQKEWTQLAAKLTKTYLQETKMHQNLLSEGRKEGLVGKDNELKSSKLAKDLREQGLQVVEKLPQLKEARQACQTI